MKIFRLIVLPVTMCAFFFGLAAQVKNTDKKKKTKEVTFSVNMTCENCKAKIERHISWEKGVKDLTVNLDKKQVTIKYDPAKTAEDKLKKAIETLEFTCQKVEE
ncbi:MAG: heavy-metal-associated domain-containing protein [Tannerella sp.]|jgi:copper chaperone CopZ|nr:heavy-metal-associated domain-containing protein [Tannerella sp.]